MEKTYKYYYKRYMNGEEEYFSYNISACNKREALLKIIADHQGIIGNNSEERMKKVEYFLNQKIGKNWKVNSVLSLINPIGSADVALYRIDRIIQIKNCSTSETPKVLI